MHASRFTSTPPNWPRHLTSSIISRPTRSTPFPYSTLFRSQSAVLGNGGEVFALDMGEPVRIRDLAEQMIRLAGKSSAKTSPRSEEHTSELQSPDQLVSRPLPEKKTDTPTYGSD